MFRSNTPPTSASLTCILISLLGTACGVKGPPLPPIAVTPQASESARINTKTDSDADLNKDEDLSPSPLRTSPQSKKLNSK